MRRACHACRLLLEQQTECPTCGKPTSFVPLGAAVLKKGYKSYDAGSGPSGGYLPRKRAQPAPEQTAPFNTDDIEPSSKRRALDRRAYDLDAEALAFEQASIERLAPELVREILAFAPPSARVAFAATSRRGLAIYRNYRKLASWTPPLKANVFTSHRDSGRTYTKFSSIKNRASQSTYGYASISHKCLEPGYDLSLGRTIHTYKLDVHTSQLVKQGKGGELVLLETGEFEETLRQLWYQHKGDPLIIENCRRRCAGGLYSLHMEAVVAILYLGFAIDRPEFVRRRHLLSVTVSRVPCEPCARLLLGLLARFPELVLRLKSSLLTADGTAGLKCLAAFQPPERLWFRFMPDDEVRRKFGPDEQSDAAEEVARWLHHQAGFQPSTAAPHPSLLELATSNLDVGALQDGVRVFVESQLRTVTLPALWNLLSERVLIQLLLVLAGGELDELLTKKVLTKKLTEKEMAYLRQCAGAAKKDESRPKVKRAAKPKDFANSLREAAKALATRAGDEATRKAIKKHVLDQIRISPSSWGQYQSKIKQATPAALDQEIETVKSLYRPFNVAGKSITLNWKEQGATRAELLTLAFPEQRALPEEREVELETGEKEEEGEYWASDEAAPEARCLFCGVEVPAFTQFCNSSCEELCLQSGDW